MKASQKLPGVFLAAASSAASQGNLVIENLVDFAAAGVPGICQLCLADCAAPPAPSRD